MIVRAAEVPHRDASVMTETVACTANPLLKRDGGYGIVSPTPLRLGENGSNSRDVSAHGEHESPPRDASVMTRFPCLRPLRGKGPTAYVLELGPLDTPCWIWQGCLNSKGYPVRGTKDGRYLVHRRVRELAHGLADGEQAHHRCERRACVNPAHLDAHRPLAHARLHYGNATIAERTFALLAGGRPMHLADIAEVLEAPAGSVSVALYRAARRGELVALGHQFFAAAEQEAA